jgi:hypothetical protein
VAKFFMLLAWLLQLGLVLLLVDAGWMKGQLRIEQGELAIHLGEQRAHELQREASEVFARCFIETGIVHRSYELLLPDPQVPKQGMEAIAPWFFKWLQHRIEVAWLLTFQVILRAMQLREWLIALTVVIAAASIDGYAQCQIKRWDNALASADRYLLARTMVLTAIALPSFYVLSPVAISLIIIPAWGTYVAAAGMLLLAHAQHRI